MAVCTWNPTQIGANITLSNNNLTWTSSSSTFTSGLGSLGYIAGHGATNASLFLYYEVTELFVGSVRGPTIGIANAGQSVADYLGAGIGTAIGIGLDGASGQTLYINTNVGTLFTTVTGDIVGVAVDFLHQKIWWTKNGTTWNNDVIGNQNPVTNTGGQTASGGGSPPFGSSGNYQIIFPAFGNLDSGDSQTANFGATAFHWTVPSGFSAWNSVYDVTQGMFLLSP